MTLFFTDGGYIHLKFILALTTGASAGDSAGAPLVASRIASVLAILRSTSGTYLAKAMVIILVFSGFKSQYLVSAVSITP